MNTDTAFRQRLAPEVYDRIQERVRARQGVERHPRRQVMQQVIPVVVRVEELP